MFGIIWCGVFGFNFVFVDLLLCCYVIVWVVRVVMRVGGLGSFYLKCWLGVKVVFSGWDGK